MPESFPSAGSLTEVPPILLRVFVRDFFFFPIFVGPTIPCFTLQFGSLSFGHDSVGSNWNTRPSL